MALTILAAEGDPETDPVETEETPALLSDPFWGSSNLDDSGDAIVCLDNGVTGPTPKEGQDKYAAWNDRSTPGEDDAEDPTVAPDADPAATVAGFKTLADAKGGYLALAKRFGALAAKDKALRASAKLTAGSLRAALKTNAELVEKTNKANASAAKTAADFKAFKEGEPQRFNAAATRLVASQGVPPVAATPGSTLPGNAKDKGDTSSLRGKDKIAASIRQQLFSK